MVGIFTEIAADTVVEILGFSDVDYVALLIFHYIYSRRDRKLRGLVTEIGQTWVHISPSVIACQSISCRCWDENRYGYSRPLKGRQIHW